MEPILVIQDLDALPRLKNRSIVVETDNIELIKHIKTTVQLNNYLFCIKINIKQEITSIDFKEEWQNVPLVIYTDELGRVRDLIRLIPLLKKLNVKFFLNGTKKQNYEAVQILSSLGIYSGIVIDENSDWEKLTDLMYYSLCGKVIHAPIEPFQYVYDTYVKNTLVDYGTVFFNNPAKFLYVSGNGQVAFSKQNLEQKNFFLDHVDKINELDKNADYQQYTKSWQAFFYEPTPCAACAAWRICLGKYAHLKDTSLCQSFAVELLDTIENRKFKKTDRI
jgi:radical SAM protein with 4Fe4S-binding SPASM domain